MTRARDIADQQDNLGGAVAPFVAGKNFVINGGFDIWQRGTSITPTGATIYSADRWTVYNANMTVSRQTTSDTTNLPNIQYCARVQRTAGNTGTGQIYLINPFETINSIPLAGKTVTISFYARAGANYSTTSNILNYRVTSGLGTNENPLNGYTSGADVISANATLTSTWQRFSATATVSANATELWVGFVNTPTGTAGANDWYEVTGVQLELGSIATPFSRAGGSIGGELALCQRYYERSYNLDMPSGTANSLGNGAITNANAGNVPLSSGAAGNVVGFNIIPFKVTKRIAPTMVVYDYDGTANAVRVYPADAKRVGVTGLASIQTSGAFQFMSFNNTGVVTITTAANIMFHWTADAEL
jgi:hypothetical protein